MSEVKVTQVDIDAARAWRGYALDPENQLSDPLAEAFARHRIAALDEAARVVGKYKRGYKKAVSAFPRGVAIQGCLIAATFIMGDILALKEKTDD